MNSWRPMDESLNRRQFLGNTQRRAATVWRRCPSPAARNRPDGRGPGVAGFIGKGDVVLFQGDSITDAGRDRNDEGNANDRAGPGRAAMPFHRRARCSPSRPMPA